MARPSRADQARAKRKERVKFGTAKMNLSIDPATRQRLEKEGLVARWANDVKGRVEELRERGYEFVRDPEGQIEAGEKGGSTDMGSAVSKIVGENKDGSPMRAYLMVQSKEFYEEDQALKEEINQKTDEAIRRGTPSGPNQASVSEGGGRTYVKNVDYKP